MVKKRVVVMPSGGLGNRMRVIASCIELAKQQNRSIYIIWPEDATLGCSMTDIFESIGIEYQTFPTWKKHLFEKIYRHGAIRRYYKIYKIFTNFLFGSSIFDRDIQKSDLTANFDKWRETTNIFVSTCYAFGSCTDLNDVTKMGMARLQKAYCNFKIIPYLENQALAEYKKIEFPYIGIHIRRTDHAELMRKSPFENYLYAIDNILKEKSDQKFFLASDDPQTKMFLQEKYKGSIYILELKLGRNDVEGVHAGVIELLLLSKSTRIICSKVSSYSTAAILIGNITDAIYV